ncbi:MAG: threonine aldolase family protein [Acidimicrobiales bacterium]
MATAEVGDDVYREDPTVRRLEETYASLVGKPSALYVPSGTMANQLMLRVLASPGTAVIAGARQHIVLYENAASARNAGVQFHTVDDAGGDISPSDVTSAIEAAGHHQPQPSLVCVENTHMAAGGAPWSKTAIRQLARAAGDLPVHMDGARLFNAQVASSTSAKELARPVTTVMSCLSKGLCAPVGSVLAGPTEIMEAARAERARMGGAMRQAGVIAAAGLVALRAMVDRLADDHVRAGHLAREVAERWPGSGLDPERVRTNIVSFRHPDPGRLLGSLRADGVLAGTIAPGVVRLVTHNGVTDEGAQKAVRAIRAAP